MRKRYGVATNEAIKTVLPVKKKNKGGSASLRCS